jgi:hypothetical protein
MDCSFSPDPLPVWANHRTFSVEPYFTATLAADAAARWNIAYRF